MILPTKQFTIYKPKITDDKVYYAAIYKEVKPIRKDFCSADPLDVFTTEPEATAKAATNSAKPSKGDKKP